MPGRVVERLGAEVADAEERLHRGVARTLGVDGHVHRGGVGAYGEEPAEAFGFGEEHNRIAP